MTVIPIEEDRFGIGRASEEMSQRQGASQRLQHLHEGFSAQDLWAPDKHMCNEVQLPAQQIKAIGKWRVPGTLSQDPCFSHGPPHVSGCLTSGCICAPINVIQDVTLRWLPGQPNKVLESLPLKNHLFIHPFIEQILPWCLDLALERNGWAPCELLVLFTARSLGQHH